MRFDDLAGGPDQDVGIPDGRHAVFGERMDLHAHIAGLVSDRDDPARLRQREERTLHEVALVARARGASGDHEGVERGTLGWSKGTARHGPASAPEAARMNWRLWLVMPGRQHAPTRIGGRRNGAAIGPGFQIGDRVDHAAAELAIGRAGAIGAVFFEGPGR